jgi:hypothetical protein
MDIEIVEGTVHRKDGHRYEPPIANTEVGPLPKAIQYQLAGKFRERIPRAQWLAASKHIRSISEPILYWDGIVVLRGHGFHNCRCAPACQQNVPPYRMIDRASRFNRTPPQLYENAIGFQPIERGAPKLPCSLNNLKKQIDGQE